MAVKVKQQSDRPLTAVLYARVSTEEQSRRESIETQIHYAQQQCEREQIPLIQIYKDEGVSGTIPFDRRPGGSKLLSDARAGTFTLVLLYKVDRLGRSDIVSHVARHHLETLGVGVRSLTEPFDTSTPHGRFMFSILSANSAMERENIRQRTQAGLHRVASQGRWANGRPPYGYKIEDHRLVPDENEAKVVKTIFTLANKRHSLVAICEHLNAQGIPTREGKRWRFGNVARILHRTAYRGLHQWGGGNTVITAVPSLVSVETWDKAQAAIALNARASRGNSKRDYLLKSLVRCGFCQRSMTGITVETGYGKHYYYRCTGKTDPDRTVPCAGRYPKAEWLEALVWNTLADWILRREDLEEAIRQSVQEQDAERRACIQTVTVLKKQLADKASEHDRVVGAFRRGLLSEDDLAQQLADIAQEKTRLLQTLTALEDRDLHIDTAQLTAQICQQLDRYRHDVQRGALPLDRKRRIVEAFVQEVRVQVRKGQDFSGAVREVIPFREHTARAERGVVATVWQRDGQQHAAPASSVEVLYRFPFTGKSTDTLMVADSPSPKRRSNIKTSSAIPA